MPLKQKSVGHKMLGLDLESGKVLPAAGQEGGLTGSVDGVIVAAPLGGAGSGGGVQAVRAVLSPRSLLEVFEP